jgi:VWFA-related protein
MKRQYPLAVCFIFVVAALSYAQQAGSPSDGQGPQQGAAQNRQEGDEVVRITTNLVQVDAVVTDKSGKPVTNLKPQEIQIYEDNRSQKVTFFSYISSGGGDSAPTKPDLRGNQSTDVPLTRVRPGDVRRTIAVVVDDLGLSSQSIYYLRRALKKFIDEQMQPGDLIAIIRTSGGVGALQQFTSDKRLLYAAVENIKWYGLGRGGVGPSAPFVPPRPGVVGAFIDEKNREADEFRDDVFTVGTLGAVSYVVRGLNDLPGRKSILLISDGFRLINREPLTREAGMEKSARNNRTIQKLESLIDQASRASVVIYTMNASGLQTLSSITAEDSMADSNSMTGARTAERVGESLAGRRAAAFDLQSGLDYLAEKTGGISIRNTNDLAGGIKKILEDQRGYYLIGYRPDQSTFDPRTGRRAFHHLTLKVLRPGTFNVRMRDGFFGVSEDESVRPQATARDQLVRALISPFGSDAVPVGLTSLFANEAGAGSFMRSLLHVDGGALTFTDEPDDWHQARFDVVAVTFGENGNVVDEVTRVDTVRVRGETYKQILKSGFIYMLTLPIKKPGAYQLRVALRDQSSQRVGSASQFVEVPDMKKNRLELSGILLSTGQRALTEQPLQGAGSATQSNAGQKESFDTAMSAALRRFRQGDALRYSFVIYNARPGKDTGQPRLQIQARLFRSGQPVFTGKVQPFVLSDPPDLGRLSASSVINLGADMVPGEYTLQVIVTDLLAGDKYRTATGWVDFEIVK